MSISEEERATDDGDCREVHDEAGDWEPAGSPSEGGLAWLRAPTRLRRVRTLALN